MQPSQAEQKINNAIAMRAAMKWLNANDRIFSHERYLVSHSDDRIFLIDADTDVDLYTGQAIKVFDVDGFAGTCGLKVNLNA